MDDRDGYNAKGYRDPTPEKIIRADYAKNPDATRYYVHVPRVAERTEADEQIAVIIWAEYMKG